MGDEQVTDGGFSVGSAPADAKPEPGSPGLPSPADKEKKGEDAAPEGAADADELEKTMMSETVPLKRIPRNEAFELFKQGSGSAMQEEVNDQQRELIQKKREVKALGDCCNANKAKIDSMNRLLQHKQQEDTCQNHTRIKASWSRPSLTKGFWLILGRLKWRSLQTKMKKCRLPNLLEEHPMAVT